MKIVVLNLVNVQISARLIKSKISIPSTQGLSFIAEGAVDDGRSGEKIEAGD